MTSKTMFKLLYRSQTDGVTRSLGPFNAKHDEASGRYTFTPIDESVKSGPLELEASSVLVLDESRLFVTEDLGVHGKVVEMSLKTIPIIEEVVSVGKRVVPGRHIKVSKRVETEQVALKETLKRGEVQIERHSRERVLGEDEHLVDHSLEDGTIVIPVIEERAVTRIERVLIEEIYLRATYAEEPFEEQVTLRKTRVDIEDARDSPVEG